MKILPVFNFRIAKNIERELLCEISRIRSSTTYEALEKARAKKKEQIQRKISDKKYQIECDIYGHISSIDKFVGRQEFIKVSFICSI